MSPLPHRLALRSPARVLAIAGALSLALALLAAVPGQAQETEQQEVTPARVEGDTRFHTAAEIATLTFDETTTTAHLVEAAAFPDALAASFGAGIMQGPILLVPSDDTDPDSPTSQTLRELEVDRVVIVGGEAAISRDVERDFAQRGYDTSRLSGANRYETAAAVAAFYGRQHVGTVLGQRTALLTGGDTFADALAAGPIAARVHLPLLLTPATQAHPAVDAALADLDIERLILVGGESAIAGSVQQHYEDVGYTVERWAGENRMDTARVVADHAVQRLGFEHDLALLARGDDFPDALAAGPHGGVFAAPILLSASADVLSPTTREWFVAACPEVEAVRAIGGRDAVSTQVLAEAVEAAESCIDSDAETRQTWILAPQEAVTVAPGDEVDNSVIFDEGDPRRVSIALLPCANADPTDTPHVFADRDGDGVADDIGSSDTGGAVITAVDGTSFESRHVLDVTPGTDDILEFTTTSQVEDCAVTAVYHDENGNGQLDVDAEGRPLEPFNYSSRAWSQ